MVDNWRENLKPVQIWFGKISAALWIPQYTLLENPAENNLKKVFCIAIAIATSLPAFQHAYLLAYLPAYTVRKPSGK